MDSEDKRDRCFLCGEPFGIRDITIYRVFGDDIIARRVHLLCSAEQRVEEGRERRRRGREAD